MFDPTKHREYHTPRTMYPLLGTLFDQTECSRLVEYLIFSVMLEE